MSAGRERAEDSTENLGRRARVAVIDMNVARDSPAGSCVMAEVEALATKFDVTVFSYRLDLAPSPWVRFVRIVGAPSRILLVRYVWFHAMVACAYLYFRMREGRADWVQATQGQLPVADICYAHFCHRSYLAHQWRSSSVGGARRVARLANHALNAVFESLALRRARRVVVPSKELAEDLRRTYPNFASNIVVISNPVDVEWYERPAVFDRFEARRSFDLPPAAIVVGFVALGDFARKGLGLMLEALSILTKAGEGSSLHFLVVGGQPGEIDEFEALARRVSLADRITFVGLQRDIRPYLWTSDVFALPSSYEVFPLVVLQALAAGLPAMIDARLSVLRQVVEPDVSGWTVERDAMSIAEWLRALPANKPRFEAMGAEAVRRVRPYGLDTFRSRWLSLLTDARSPI